MMQVDEHEDQVVGHLLWVGVMFILIFLLAALYGCNTAKALESAPMEFWNTLGTVFKALLDDILSVLW